MRSVGEGRLAAGGLLGCALGIAGLIVPDTGVDVSAMAILGAGITTTSIGANTLLQRRTPNHLLGRVDAAAEVAVSVPQTLFIGIGAALVAAVNYQILLTATAALMLTNGLWLLTRPDQHTTTTRPSTCTPEAEGTASSTTL